jgi:nitroreductase
MDNPILNQIASHRTQRSFEQTPVDPEVVAQCVRVAQQAATSSHVQGYALLQVHDSTRRERLAELTGGQQQVAQAGAFFIVCADQRRHRLIARREGRDYRPNLETFLVGTIDASLFAQNLVLAFESLGLGTCYIGGLRTRLPEVDELLDLPDDCFPLYGLCVGVPTEEGNPRARLPLDGVLFHDSYPDDDALLKAIDEHDAVMAQEYERRGLPGRNWSGGVSRKFEKPLREHLFDYYTSKGARLE